VSILYGMNRRMDTGIGRIGDVLERLGLAQNTFLLFTSDNGPQFGGPTPEMRVNRYNGRFNGCKGNVYEGGIRVPAILRWPAGLEGTRQLNDLIHFNDWFLTLLAVAGVQPPKTPPLDGHNVLSILQGERGKVDPLRFWQWNRYTPLATCNAAMRDGAWKLLRPAIREAMTISREDGDMDRRLRYQPEGINDICRDPEPPRQVPPPPKPLLFNLDDDPYEQKDLADAFPERVAVMQRELDRWFDSVEAERKSIRD
jgi:arylsulfatase A